MDDLTKSTRKALDDLERYVDWLRPSLLSPNNSRIICEIERSLETGASMPIRIQQDKVEMRRSSEKHPVLSTYRVRPLKKLSVWADMPLS